ncbi:MAG: tripartite tricarboxylate transporter substrate-binding protein [Pseudomonadota bacterium]
MCVALWGGPLRAEGFPNRPIRLIVPYAAGGGVDIVARAVADGLAQQFGWTVVVEKPDRRRQQYRFCGGRQSRSRRLHAAHGIECQQRECSLYANMAYDPMTDLTPIVMVGRVPMVLLASLSAPVKSVRELIDYAKKHPGTLNFGSGGAGTSEHLTYELFKRRAGIEAIHVPYRGGAAVYPDLISGQVQFLFNNQLQAMSFVQVGTVRALAIANPTRSQQLPNVPTMAEEGIADFATAGWWGIMGPRDTPPDIVDRINQAVNKVLDAPELTKRLNSLGAERIGGTPASFVAFFKAETATWAAIISAEKIKVE